MVDGFIEGFPTTDGRVEGFNEGIELMLGI